MSRFYEPVSGVEGVSAGNTATVKMPVNRRHLIVRLLATATGTAALPTTATSNAVDVIEKVYSYVGGKLIREELVEDLLAIPLLNGLPVDPSGAATLYYAEPWRSSVMDEQVTAWDTYDVKDFTLKVKLRAGVVNPTLTVIDGYDTGYSMNGGKRILQIIKRTPYSFNAGTLYTITALPSDLPTTRIYLKGQAGVTIDAIRVTLNDTQVAQELTRQQNASFLSDYRLDATKFSFPVLFEASQQLFDYLQPQKNIAVRVQSSAPQSIDVLLEQVAPNYI